MSIKDTGVANLIGTLVMLLSLLFAGLLINREKISWWLTPLLYASPFHSALESLLVSQLSSLTLKEHKYGIDIEVPASVLLSSFGFRVGDFALDNILLAGTFVLFNGLSVSAERRVQTKMNDLCWRPVTLTNVLPAPRLLSIAFPLTADLVSILCARKEVNGG